MLIPTLPCGPRCLTRHLHRLPVMKIMDIAKMLIHVSDVVHTLSVPSLIQHVFNGPIISHCNDVCSLSWKR